MEIDWHFNAPSWPSAGGLWERNVRSLKHHLRRVIGDQKLTYEEFSTLLSQLEACLNSRPLCALTENPEDLTCLTPSHFLASGPVLSIIETEKDERTRWQLTQKIFTDIWKKWQLEYLTQLNSRSKWQNKRQNLRINDIVVVHDVNLPPGKWALGRVVDLHPGKDGYVRVVTLKTKGGIHKRPITKVSLITESTGEQGSKNEEATPTRTRYKTKSLLSIFTTILLFMGLVTSGQGTSYNITQFNNNQGLYFENIANMQIIRDHWKLIVYYDTHPYWQGIKAVIKYTDYLSTICTHTKQKSHCEIILAQLNHNIAELEHYNRVLLSQQNNRRKRGLINGIGSIANSLFGVLDQQFAEQYQKDIALLKDNENHLVQLFKNQTSIIEAENNFLKRTETTIDRQYKSINQHILSLKWITSGIAQEISSIETVSDFTLSAIIAGNMFNNLQSIQNILLDTVTNVRNGQMNTHLLTPKQLHEQLLIISSHLPKDLSLPIDLHYIQDVYQLLHIRAKMTDKYLIFEIKIPLVYRDTFVLHGVYTIPVQIGERMRSLTPISGHLAVNLQKDMYVPLSRTEVESCVSMYPHNLYLCAYLYFCCGECSMRLICENQISQLQLRHSGIISVGQDCVIKDKEFTSYSKHLQISKLKITPDIHWPEVAEIAEINHIINTSVPLTELDMTEINQTKLMEISKDIQDLKSQTVLADRISYHDVHHYTAIYVVLGLVCMLGGVVLWWRLRRAPSSGVDSGSSAEAAPSPSGSASDCGSGSASGSGQRASAHALSELRVIKQDKASSPVYSETAFTN